MPEKYGLSNQELFIMNILWGGYSEMTLGEITELLQKQGFQPTIGTIKTYLTRLVKKGALQTRKMGHKLLYTPSCDKQEYEKRWAENFLSEHYNGSIRAFLSALTGKDGLDDRQIQELKEFFDE